VAVAGSPLCPLRRAVWTRRRNPTSACRGRFSHPAPATCLQASRTREGQRQSLPLAPSSEGRCGRRMGRTDGNGRKAEGRSDAHPLLTRGTLRRVTAAQGTEGSPPTRKGRETFPQRAGPHSRKRGATNPQPGRGENRRGGAKPRGRNRSRGVATSTRRKRKLPGVDADGGDGRGADAANPTRGGTPTSSEAARSSSGDESALKERRRP